VALFEVRFEDVLFTADASLADAEFTTTEADAWTATARAEGTLPEGVEAVLGGDIVHNDECEDGEFKMYASVLLLVEAADEGAAKGFAPPTGLLAAVVDAMVAGRASDMAAAWEVLDFERAAAPAPGM
jgi:hypothetical protein